MKLCIVSIFLLSLGVSSAPSNNNVRLVRNDRATSVDLTEDKWFSVPADAMIRHKRQLHKGKVTIWLTSREQQDEILTLAVLDRPDENAKLMGGERTACHLEGCFCFVSFEVPSDAAYYILVKNRTKEAQEYKLSVIYPDEDE